MMNSLMIFEGKQVEVFEFEGKVLFNPYHVGECLDLGESAVRMAIKKMNQNQVVKLKNPDVKDIDIRKLNNAGENFLTESGVYKLIFKSRKVELYLPSLKILLALAATDFDVCFLLAMIFTSL